MSEILKQLNSLLTMSVRVFPVVFVHNHIAFVHYVFVKYKCTVLSKYFMLCYAYVIYYVMVYINKGRILSTWSCQIYIMLRYEARHYKQTNIVSAININ